MAPTIRKRPRPTEMPEESIRETRGHNWVAALQLRIEYVSLDALTRPKRETRLHSKKQIALVEAGMRRFGVVQPLIVDAERRIVCGVARYLAAQNLKLAQVPIIKVEHLSEMELRAFALADNKLPELAQWDMPELAIELSELMMADDLDIEITGFGTIEIDTLILGSAADAEQEAEEVPAPEPGPAISRVGDLFQLGPDHLLLCASAREAASYRALMGDTRARMVFADLPYNVKIAGNVSGLGKVRHGEFVEGSGEMSRPEFVRFMSDIMGHCAASSTDGSIHYLCMDWRSQREMIEAGEANYTELKNHLVWVKTNAGLGSFYRSQHEFIYVWKSGTAPHLNFFGLGESGRYRTNCLTYPGCNTFRKGRAEDLAAHSTVKPTLLVADLIRDVSKPGDLILDPCCGSGTTILAAARTGRRARCIELDPKYVDVAVRRCEKRLGVTAVHLASGLSFDALAESRASESGIAGAALPSAGVAT